MSSTNIRKYAVLFFAAFTLFIAIQNVFYAFRQDIHGIDFRMRYHEVECIRQGIDPYDIITKKVPSTEFALFCSPEAKPGVKRLHLYTPWEYTWFMPLSLLSEQAAGNVFLLISITALMIVGLLSFNEGRKIRNDWVDSVFAASAAIFLGSEMGGVLRFGNYGLINMLLIYLLIITLSAGHNILAGIVWAFLMTKPQIGLLFAIPILLKRRFTTVGVAVVVCLVCAVPPSLMCGKNPLELILEVPRGYKFITEETGTMLIPSTVFQMLQGKVPSELLSGISILIGSTLCFILTWRLRKTPNWFVFFAPAATCTIIWTYCRPHDRVILSLIQLLAALAALQTKKKSVLIFSLFLILLVAWPLWEHKSLLTKLMRRISLGVAVYGCWMLPKIPFFNQPKGETEK